MTMNETIKIWMHMNEYQSRDDNLRLVFTKPDIVQRMEDNNNGFMDAYLKKKIILRKKQLTEIFDSQLEVRCLSIDPPERTTLTFQVRLYE